MPPVNDTAEKFRTNFLRIPIPAHVVKRRAPPRIEDIVIVIDGSGSVGSCEFHKGKKALNTMMKMVSTDTKYATVTFATASRINFKFLTINSASSKILAIPYPSGSTNTQAGLNDAMKLFNDNASGRHARYYIQKIQLQQNLVN